MEKVLCKAGSARDSWAVGLCLASATLTGLEALHGNACQWMGLNAQQSFACSAAIATLSVFMGTFILARRP